MTTAELLQEYYRLANEAQWMSWCELFTSDVVMDEQLAGHVEGRNTLQAMMAGFGDTWQRFANVPMTQVIENDRAAVLSHISGLTMAGDPVEVDVCNYFELTGGAISYFKNVHDTLPFSVLNQASQA